MMPARHADILRRQTRALVWEEARVGGVIALWLALVGLAMLAAVRLISGVEFWVRDDQLPYVVGFWIPVAIAFLLVLSPDHSGHLSGGFSKRILRFPVATSHAVAASLISRLVFLAAASFVLAGVCTNVTDGEPGFGIVFVVALIYLAAQLFDWLRGPVSGLSTFVVILAAAAVAGALIAPESILEPAFRLLIDAGQSPGMMAGLGLAAAVATYAISLAAVRADRTGRSIGFPEIWEWRLPFVHAGVAPHRPFRTPFAAQVWFELRRSRALLPIVALCSYALLLGVHWLAFADLRGEKTLGEAIRDSAVWSVFNALMAGVVAHAISTRVIGLRRSVKSTGYEHLLPLSDAQFAASRVLAGLILLIPTLVAALSVHYFAAAPVVVFEIIPTSLREGFGSLREVIWVLLGRGLFIGIVASALLAINTRLFRRLAALALLGLIAAFTSDYLIDTRFADILHANFVAGARQNVLTPLVLSAIILTLACTAVAWRRGLFARRTLICGAAIWILIAWLFRYVLVLHFAPNRPDVAQHAFAILIALGCSAAVPLVYLSFLFDISRRRRKSRAPLERRTWPLGDVRPSPWSTAGWAAIVLAVFWLGWPARPAYVDYFRAKGHPVTLDELDEFYAEPAPGENDALAYLEVADQLTQLDQEFQTFVAEAGATLLTPPSGRQRPGYTDAYYSKTFDALLIVGGAESHRDQPLDWHIWEATRLYWTRVASQVAPTLQEIGNRDTSDARYPIDLKDGGAVLLPHLAQTRHLVRQLAVDSLYWTIAAQPARATESVEAASAVADSLTNEPVLISQLVRIANHGFVVSMIETALNRSVPGESELLRLQRACELAYPAPPSGRALDRSLAGEAAIWLNVPYLTSGVSYPDDIETGWRREPPLALVLPHELLFPKPATSLTLVRELDESIRVGSMTRARGLQLLAERESSEFFEQVSLVSPLVDLGWSAILRAYEAEWRIRSALEIARVAVAVERYRLAKGRLPGSLQELVPAFLPAIPSDYFAGVGVPLKYRVREGSEFVVYSVGFDGEDDLGVEMERWWHEGDITFTVAPLSVRTGPQISSNVNTPEPRGPRLVD